MEIEISLNNNEKMALWILAQVQDIQFQGLIDLISVFEKFDKAENVVKYLSYRFFNHWFTKPKKNSVLSTQLKTAKSATASYDELFSPAARMKQKIANEKREDCERIIYLLQRLKLAEVYEEEPEFSGMIIEKWVRITPEGESLSCKIEEGRLLIVRPRQIVRTTIFIASSFGYEDTDDLYESVLRPACLEHNYEPVRIDLSEPTSTITEAILRGIQEAELVIADLTYSRPSVYFEVGFANGMGIPLILTCRRDHLKGKNDFSRVHFDLEQYKISFWSQNGKGSFRWAKRMDPCTRIKNHLKILKPYSNKANAADAKNRAVD